jgi:glutamyl-tRNA reductase
VTLYDMDDLQREVARNTRGREAEAVRAGEIIGEEVERFALWLESLDVVPTIAALRGRANAIVDQVLQENEGRWEALSPSDRQRMELLAQAIVSRLLHEPTLRLRRSAGQDETYVHVQALRELFALEGESPETAGQPAAPAAEVASLAARRMRTR